MSGCIIAPVVDSHLLKRIRSIRSKSGKVNGRCQFIAPNSKITTLRSSSSSSSWSSSMISRLAKARPFNYWLCPVCFGKTQVQVQVSEFLHPHIYLLQTKFAINLVDLGELVLCVCVSMELGSDNIVNTYNLVKELLMIDSGVNFRGCIAASVRNSRT